MAYSPQPGSQLHLDEHLCMQIYSRRGYVHRINTKVHQETVLKVDLFVISCFMRLFGSIQNAECCHRGMPGPMFTKNPRLKVEKSCKDRSYSQSISGLERAPTVGDKGGGLLIRGLRASEAEKEIILKYDIWRFK